jgi:hypothetical protein
VSGARPLPPQLGWSDLLLAWAGGLVGYLVGEYGAGALLRVTYRAGGVEALLSWVWLPWLAGAVLCGAGAGGVLVLLRARTVWWHWIAAGALVPVASGVISWFVLGGRVEGGSVAVTVATQVLVAVLVAALVGALLALRRSRPRAPRPHHASGYAS